MRLCAGSGLVGERSYFPGLKKLQAGPRGCQGVEMRLELGIGQEHIDAGVIQNVSDLVGLEETVNGHRYGSGVQNSKERRDKLRTILQPETDPGAALEAKALLQLLRNESALVPKVAV